MTVFIGLDPGKDGAIALVAGDGRLMSITDMPSHPEYIREVLAQYQRDKFVTIEAQQAMPKQGVTSMFSLGENYGLLVGIVTGLQIPYQTVRPQAWMRALGIPAGADKKKHIDVALGLFPTGDFKGPRGGPKDGRADAALIAEYGRRTHGGGK